MRDNLETELEKCVQTDSVCRITGEFVDAITNGNEYLGDLNNYFDNLPGYLSLGILEKGRSRFLLQEKLVKPLNECLLKSMLTKLDYSSFKF